MIAADHEYFDNYKMFVFQEAPVFVHLMLKQLSNNEELQTIMNMVLEKSIHSNEFTAALSLNESWFGKYSPAYLNLKC